MYFFLYLCQQRIDFKLGSLIIQHNGFDFTCLTDKIFLLEKESWRILYDICYYWNMSDLLGFFKILLTIGKYIL